MEQSPPTGPLHGLRVIEMEGIGPAPFAAMMLADMGADVVSIVRPGKTVRDARNFIWRGRRIVELDLKAPGATAAVLDLLADADILIEGFRPGVMERLGLGPEAALARNPALVYGRMTGWGQQGPLAMSAGHDINYIAITGALEAFRAASGEPVAPLNLVGDYGGGALFLLVGVLAALTNARLTGRGQVVDAAMCDGVSLMLTMFQSARANGRWLDAPRANHLDGGAHYYGTYRCADGKYLAVGAIEQQFYALLCRKLGIDDPEFDAQLDRSHWPHLRRKLEAILASRPRDEWDALLAGSDACVAPVLSMAEAPAHPHLQQRGVYIEVEGQPQPAPAPRFSATPSAVRHSAASPPIDISTALSDWRIDRS